MYAVDRLHARFIQASSMLNLRFIHAVTTAKSTIIWEVSLKAHKGSPWCSPWLRPKVQRTPLETPCGVGDFLRHFIFDITLLYYGSFGFRVWGLGGI
jgi:hypothetical protein